MRSSRACSMFRTAGTPNFHMATSSTRNAAEPQMTSFLRRQQRRRRLLAVVDRDVAALRQLVEALLAASCRRGFARLVVSAANAGAATNSTAHRDAGYCDERTDASTHRSSCPGFSPR